MKVLLTGATGMIGGLILRQCLVDSRVTSVVSLVRRASGVSHEKLQEVVVKDFMDLAPHQTALQGIDVVFYCLGAYTGAVSRDTLHQVTVDYPIVLSNILENSDVVRFCLLSGMGADRTMQARASFAKDKGEVEAALSARHHEFHAFRPGYIYPVQKRKEPNVMYRVSRALYPLFRLLGNNFSIKSTELASVMFKVGIDGHKEEVMENRDMLALLSV